MVVIGASAGLGAALGRLHHQRGDSVMAVARRKERLALLASATVREDVAAARWIGVGADVADVNELQQLAVRIGNWRPIARMYFVAATNEVRRGGDLPERLATVERYHRLLFTSWVALSETLEQQRAIDATTTLVAISSIASAIPFGGLELYGAGKAALEAWARAARGSGPRRVVVRPGRFESDFFEPRPFDASALPLERARRIVRAVDKGRLDVDAGGARDRIGGRLVGLAPTAAGRIVRGAAAS